MTSNKLCKTRYGSGLDGGVHVLDGWISMFDGYYK